MYLLKAFALFTLFIFHLSSQETFLISKILPPSLIEQDVLERHGYQIQGKKTSCLYRIDDILYWRSQLELTNTEDEKCRLIESKLIPLKKLQFPLEWKPKQSSGCLSYGPYQMDLGELDNESASKLIEVIQNSNDKINGAKPPSVVAKELGFEWIIHSTRPENLIAILRTGELNAGRGKSERVRGDPFGNDQFVFCSLLKGSEDRENLLRLTGNNLPILVFQSGDVLDQFDWHASAGHPYGAYFHFATTDRKLFPSAHRSDPESFRRLLLFPSTSKKNEVVFHHSLPLDHLARIYVARGEKEKIISILGDERWKERIIEIDPLVKLDTEIRESELPEWLLPLSRNSHDRVRLAILQNELDLCDFKLLIKREYPALIPICDQFPIRKQTLKKFLVDLFHKAGEVYGHDADRYSNALRFFGIH